MIRGHVTFEIETCKGCELCIDACPQDSLRLSDSINRQGFHYAVLVEDNCTGCVNCALVCPDAVITVYRQDRKKGRVPVARISNVQKDIRLTVEEQTVPAGGG